jgi:hypothetical protein
MSEEAAAAEQPEETEVVEEVPEIAPEDLPKVSLEILWIVAQAQRTHGLIRNVPDYSRYRK